MSNKIRLPVIELNELLKSVSEVCALSSYHSDILENVHVLFEDGKITAAVIRSLCTQYSFVEYETTDSEIGLEFLLPFHLMRKLLMLDLANAELWLFNNVIEYRDDRTGANIFVQLEEVINFPSRKVYTGEYQWMVKREDLKDLLEARLFTSDMTPQADEVLLTYSEEKFLAYGYDTKSLAVIEYNNDGLDPEDMDFLLPAKMCSILSKLLDKSHDEYVYFYQDEKKTNFISTSVWCLICNVEQNNDSIPSRKKLYTVSFNPIAERSMYCGIKAGEFRRCLKMHDIIGYEEVAVLNRAKYFEMEINVVGDMKIINDLSEYGTKGVIPLPSVLYNMPPDVAQKRIYPFEQFVKFLSRIPAEDTVVFYPGDDNKTPAMLQWKNRKQIIMRTNRTT